MAWPKTNVGEGANSMRNKEGTSRVNETATLFARVGNDTKTGILDTSVMKKKSGVEEDFFDETKHLSVANQVLGRIWKMCGLVSAAWKIQNCVEERCSCC